MKLKEEDLRDILYVNFAKSPFMEKTSFTPICQLSISRVIYAKGKSSILFNDNNIYALICIDLHLPASILFCSMQATPWTVRVFQKL